MCMENTLTQDGSDTNATQRHTTEQAESYEYDDFTYVSATMDKLIWAFVCTRGDHEPMIKHFGYRAEADAYMVWHVDHG